MPLSEFEIIDSFFSGLDKGPGVVLGVGDDCALLQLSAHEELAVSVDTVVAGVHFPRDAAPGDIAFKAVAAAVSDLGAMGARPLGCTLSLTLTDADEDWLRGFRNGIAEACESFALPLVGGDITRGPVSVAVQVMGAVPAGKALRRSGARVGDRVCVSGVLGDAAAALHVLDGRWKPQQADATYLLQRYYRPQPPLALARTLPGIASAAIDISDGLLADAGHIAEASGVRVALDSSCIPLSESLKAHHDREQVLEWSLRGGDDYELCFCLGPGSEIPETCTQVGVVEPGKGILLDGMEVDTATGFRHF